jgi:hypothetical protein
MLRDEIARPKERRPFDWLLWWRIDEEEVRAQAADYYKFGPLHTARGWAMLCLLFSVLITALVILLGAGELTGLIDAAVLGVLAAFIYFGHRWASIAAMVIWTLEKGFSALGGPSQIVVSVIWWSIYMHAFLLAFRVENERRHMTSRPEEVF